MITAPIASAPIPPSSSLPVENCAALDGVGLGAGLDVDLGLETVAWGDSFADVDNAVDDGAGDAVAAAALAAMAAPAS